MKHPLHAAVAKELEQRLGGRGELIRDPACVGDPSAGGLQHLPLFVGATKSRANHMCDVDLLVLSGGHVRVIVEVEESGFSPTKICGKFLQAALATHFIHDSHEGQAVPYGRVLFVQVIDGSKALKTGSKKDLQGKLIEEQIRKMVARGGMGVADYRLFFVCGATDLLRLGSVGEAVSSTLG